MARPKTVGPTVKSAAQSSNPSESATGPVTIQQAVFTSARTSRKDGYQLAAWSPGVTSEDAKDLTVWGPAHDSIIASDCGDFSLNFHPLGRSKYCVSRTMLGEAEYSMRGGRQVYTHCLIVERAALARFHNNPFAVLEAAMSLVDLGPGSVLPEELSTLRTLPPGRSVDLQQIAALERSNSRQTMVAWMHHALTNPRILLAGSYDHAFIARFFNLLPVAVRPEFSFSTRLRFSPRRPFRCIGLAHDREELKKAQRHDGRVFFDFDHPSRTSDWSRHGWATCIQVALCSRNPDRVARLLEDVPRNLSLGDLPAWGHRIRMALSGPSEEVADATAKVDSSAGTVESSAGRSAEVQRKLLEEALGGDVLALETLHQRWSTSDPALEDERFDCSRHLEQVISSRELTGAGATAAEILQLLLSAK